MYGLNNLEFVISKGSRFAMKKASKQVYTKNTKFKTHIDSILYAAITHTSCKTSNIYTPFIAKVRNDLQMKMYMWKGKSVSGRKIYIQNYRVQHNFYSFINL